MPAIEVRGVHKTFRLPHERQTTITERALSLFRPIAYERFEALRDVTLEIEKGSFAGIIGHNGSGKSTLLKVIAGLLIPDAGSVRVRGNMASLLELGLGFSQELTVHENVGLYATLLGFPRHEAQARVEEAIDFADLQRFRDAKLKNLSTGMCARLGFATALQAPFDILLLDEILAVGDADFQEKCWGVFTDLKRQDKTIILVTHDLASIKRLCDCAFLLSQGRLVASGDPDKVIDTYLEQVGQAPLPEAVVAGDQQRWGDRRVRFVRGWLEDESGRAVTEIRVGAHPTLVLLADVAEDTEEPVFGMIVQDDSGEATYVFNTLQRGLSTGTLPGGERVEIRIPFTVPLRNGRYFIHPAVADRSATNFHDWVNRFVEFTVCDSTCREGIVDLQAGFGWRPARSTDDADFADGDSTTDRHPLPEKTAATRLAKGGQEGGVKGPKRHHKGEKP